MKRSTRTLTETEINNLREMGFCIPQKPIVVKPEPLIPKEIKDIFLDVRFWALMAMGAMIFYFLTTIKV